ncbi:MAG TPA: hypothetical protein VHV51_17100 [Polyangiaceae bacterium]|jgi:hypothetical protein|nr:hypothetical protein [Polyangiaceae bacterium]
MCAAIKTRISAAEHGAKTAKLQRLLIEDRIVALCGAHAEKVRALAPASIADLRRHFQEKRGKRSLLSRRAPLDRRAFPARPEGRRASTGRRASDRI